MGFRLTHGVNMYRRFKTNVVLVDYRGYGASEGKPSEAGLIQDGISVLEHLQKHEHIDE